MGVFDKFKKILFDEEIEEVNTGDELPERTPKKNFRSESGFIDHNAQKDEDVIKEVVYEPKADEARPASRTSKYGAEEYEKTEDIPRQISRYEDTKPYMEREEVVEEKIEKAIQHEREPIVEEPVHEIERKYDFGADFDTPVVEEHIPKKDTSFVQTDKYGLRRDYKAILRNETEVRHGELEHKDYAAIVRERPETTPGKKPFVVTPVISPVYGILDKNYTPDSVIEKNKDNSNLDAQKKRLYGDSELIVEKVVVKTTPAPVVEEKVEPTKEEEYMDSIQSIIEEEIPKKAVKTVEEAMDDTEEYTPVEPEVTYEEPEVETYEEPEVTYEEPEVMEKEVPIEEDPITPVVEEEPYYEEPEVEEEMDAPSVSIDTLIDNPIDDEDETPRQELDDTIETDLFNLIDSMYNKDEEGE